MKKQELIDATVDFVKKEMQGDSGHDWWHIHQVWKNAIRIGKKEKADMLVVQLAALLHDIADWKFYGGDDSIGPAKARKFMESLQIDKETMDHVCHIIKDISFKGAGVKTEMKTIEGKIVQDADRLEALGAMGIARTFGYGGHKGRPIYDPAVKPVMHASFNEYKKNTAPTINHFYEKLLLLKDRMNTETGKKLAEKRHVFMEKFLDQFFAEWNGKK